MAVAEETKPQTNLEHGIGEWGHEMPLSLAMHGPDWETYTGVDVRIAQRCVLAGHACTSGISLIIKGGLHSGAQIHANTFEQLRWVLKTWGSILDKLEEKANEPHEEPTKSLWRAI